MSSRSIREIPSPLGAMGDRRIIQHYRLEVLDRHAANATDLVRIRFLFGDIVLVNHPELIHEVLVTSAKSFEKSPVMRSSLYPLVGDGLFTSDGELWRRQRKLMSPIFHHQAIRPFAADMVGAAARTMEELRHASVVDVARETMRITMAVASKTLFSVDTYAEADVLGSALTVALDWAGTESSRPSLIAQARVAVGLKKLADELPSRLSVPLRSLADRALVPILWPGQRSEELREALGILNQRVERLIRERSESGADPRQDLLGRLLDARDDRGSPMSPKQVRDEVLTLFVAGHETTATALAWSLMLLGQHPDAYARARAEIDALGRLPTEEDLPRLAYTSRVFKESLRLYPPVYVFGRVATQDVVVGDHLCPKGTIVLVSPYALQRRPDLWVEPKTFNPDRFLPHNETERHRSAFIPFSAGPRTCIGNTFALMEGPLVLATMLHYADFGLIDPHGTKPEPSATLRPKGGIAMRLRQRT